MWKPTLSTYSALSRIPADELASIKTPRRYLTALMHPGFVHPNGKFLLALGKADLDSRPIWPTDANLTNVLAEDEIRAVRCSGGMMVAVLAGRKVIWANTRITHAPMRALDFAGANFPFTVLLERQHPDTQLLAQTIRKDRHAVAEVFRGWQFDLNA